MEPSPSPAPRSKAVRPGSASPSWKKASSSGQQASRHRYSSFPSRPRKRWRRPSATGWSRPSTRGRASAAAESAAKSAARSAVAAAGHKLDVHLKVDTGMHRVGADPEDTVALAQAVCESPSWVSVRCGLTWRSPRVEARRTRASPRSRPAVTTRCFPGSRPPGSRCRCGTPRNSAGAIRPSGDALRHGQERDRDLRRASGA